MMPTLRHGGGEQVRRTCSRNRSCAPERRPVPLQRLPGCSVRATAHTGAARRGTRRQATPARAHSGLGRSLADSKSWASVTVYAFCASGPGMPLTVRRQAGVPGRHVWCGQARGSGSPLQPSALDSCQSNQTTHLGTPAAGLTPAGRPFKRHRMTCPATIRRMPRDARRTRAGECVGSA